jgi:hypothetical protein
MLRSVINVQLGVIRNMTFANAIATVALFFCVSPVYAVPAPVSVDGELQEGAEIVITGSNFGAKRQASPVFFDTQDAVWINGDLSRPYSDLVHGQVLVTGDGLPWRGQHGEPMIWRADGYSRIRGNFLSANRRVFLESPAGFPSPESGEVDELYIRWWFRSSFDVSDNSFSPDGTNTHAKFIRVWDTRGNDPTIRLSWTNMALGGRNVGGSWGSSGQVVGEWNLMELHVNTSTKQIRAFTNGVLRHSQEGGVGVFDAPYNGLQPRLWGLDGSGSRNWSGEVVEFSDYYADTTRARVEIGDSPKWADVTIREPQVATSWTSNRIQVVLYQGRLSEFSGKFLYVVDADGQVNPEGFPLGAAPAEPPSINEVE